MIDLFMTFGERQQPLLLPGISMVGKA